MKRIIEILMIFIKTRIKGEYQYRTSFIIDVLSFVLGYGAQAIVMMLLVDTFRFIDGWNAWEVMLLYAYTLASYALANTFLNGVMWSLNARVRSGEFDQSLVKPLDPFMYEIVSNFSEYYSLHYLLALIMIFIGAVGLKVDISLRIVLQILVDTIAGAMIQGGILILFSALSFIVMNNPLTGSLYNSIRTLAEYPISIYPKIVQIVLTTVIPLAFASYYPVQNLTRHYSSHATDVYQYLLLPIGVIFVYSMYRIWKWCIRFYGSSGS